MTKEVLLHIKGLQFEENTNQEDIEQIETICPGEYFHRNQTHYFLYEEIIEGYEKQPIKNMVKCRDKEFIITKKGPFQVQMVFEEGKKTLTNYNTPFGNILVGLDTSKIEIEEQEEKITIKIYYSLEANYQFVADCEISIVVESKEAAKS